MIKDAEQGAKALDEEAEDLRFLRDAGLELLAKLKEIRDVTRRRQITASLFAFLDQQIKTTH